MNVNPLLQIKALGQNVWLDYIQRNMLINGEVARMIEKDGLAGITSNPAIFEKAISEHHDYDEAITLLTRRGMPPKEIYEALALEDVARAAELFRPLYDKSNGHEGFVSLEVSPHLAYDTEQTISEAERLWTALNRPNILIKVPATQAGLPAITHLLAAGININVTILFSLERYRQVVDAFLAGLEIRVAQHKPVDHITSVASFFLSRIDVLVDKRLDELDRITDYKSAGALRGKAAIACARLAYQHYQQWIKDKRWQSLSSHGARTQRLLWASTGTKDPIYSDTKYVEPLIAKDTINTMPLQTLIAYREHGQPALRIEQELDEARSLPEKLYQIGIDLEAVSEQLEVEGVQKFVIPFDKLLERLSQW
ncbi:transaldolase [Nitrosomonas sp. Nm33]|uniref:transaldolase n=1 Tax=Nitrosomonas sp. Nm33 TaxID=133724 RepID=UPI0008961A12|nr:transaldolase [Nitrosomonas sp. Nm33]SDY89836.1 transaldolase/transaldolase / glucose-6-phosphate isomerase [Nitrosomonas sp. Nm33]